MTRREREEDLIANIHTRYPTESIATLVLIDALKAAHKREDALLNLRRYALFCDDMYDDEDGDYVAYGDIMDILDGDAK
jgi:hypothetical protein